jgi:hypothetical protein
MDFNLKNSPSKIFVIFVFIFGCLNLVQARLTPLNNDEAYYWMYSKYPDWGYFDHPPMIAIMIKFGYMLFRNELGVRLLVVISELITLLVVWKLLDESVKKDYKKTILFILVISVLPVFKIFGFIATPDSPLLLFSAIFLLVYKRFLNVKDLQNTLLLGLSMAALMYSKYHGGLLILLVLLSNLKLLKSPRFYVSSVFALILFIPHLYWQYSNGFPSLKYHLVERVSGFNAVNVPEYLMNLMIIHNPFVLPVCVWLIFKTKANDEFGKSLRFIVMGFFLFFFLASFRYHVEPQWTALVSIPLIILLFDTLDFESKIRRYLKWVGILFLSVNLFVRSAFMFDFLPVPYIENEFNRKKLWTEIEKLAGDRPVIFTNSYQNPSEYSFYTGKFAHSLNNKDYRKTQYDLWDFEERVHGMEVLYVPHYLTDDIKKQLTKYTLSDGNIFFARLFRNFQSLQRQCIVIKDNNFLFTRNDTNILHFKIYNPYPFSINLKHEELPVVFQLAFMNKGNMEIKKNIELPQNISSLIPGDTISADFRFTLEELPAGEYKLVICSETGMLYDTYNSEFKDVKVINKKITDN